MPNLCDYFNYVLDDEDNPYMEVFLKGIALLRLPGTNKGTAFTLEERRALGLDGLLPPQVVTLQQQVDRIYQGFLREPTDIAKYQFLRALQERSEISFYALLEQHLEEMLPIVYTPTVGLAVQQYSYLYRAPRGLSLSPLNITHADEVIENYPWHNVRMIVATDSSAILGIGDQGYGGLAIAIGKLALYSAGGGVSPYRSMPVSLDIGTNRADLREDPNYLGVRQPRLTGDEYMAFMDTFVDATYKRWPNVIMQWEDFSKDVAFAVLDRYRNKIPCFNDDIQGTGAMVLAGLLRTCALKDESLANQSVVLYGAGAAGVGVAECIITGMMEQGLSHEEALSRVYVLDSRGLLIDGQIPPGYKTRVGHPPADIEGWSLAGNTPNLAETVRNSKATILIGLSGQAGAFSKDIVETMAENSEQPVIFPLSNPNSVCEAHPQELINWTDGKALVASGSPFPGVEFDGRNKAIGQGNNAFIFPGLGFASILGKCTRISDGMIIRSAKALSEYTSAHYTGELQIYPHVNELQKVSQFVAAQVLRQAFEEGVTQEPRLEGADFEEYVQKHFWRARYLPYRYVQK